MAKHVPFCYTKWHNKMHIHEAALWHCLPLQCSACQCKVCYMLNFQIGGPTTCGYLKDNLHGERVPNLQDVWHRITAAIITVTSALLTMLWIELQSVQRAVSRAHIELCWFIIIILSNMPFCYFEFLSFIIKPTELTHMSSMIY
jgi:hypothetical protein